VREALTIGVYGWTLGTFLAALDGAGAGQLLDIRRRRGVRGADYAWANAARLQDALAGAGIVYWHRLELAPTTDLLRVQHAEDDRHGVGRRLRAELAPEYRRRYVEEILDRVDLAAVVAELPPEDAFALMCVERDPEACHRSIVAERLERELGIPVRHLRP
jgi:uncharacterized protein (DUF488 family)